MSRGKLALGGRCKMAGLGSVWRRAGQAWVRRIHPQRSINARAVEEN